MACQSPSRSMLKRCRSVFERSIPNLLQQEDNHAKSKRPRIKFAAEADIKIQNVMTSVLVIKKRVQAIDQELKNLEVKVDKLDLEREQPNRHHLLNQLCSSSQKICDAITIPKPRSPSSLFMDSGFEDSMDSSASFGSPPASPKVLDYLRKRKLLDIYIRRSCGMAKTEAEILESLFHDNFTVLKFKRAEKCLLCMIKLQRKIKNLEEGYSQLKDRLVQIIYV